MARKPLMAGNWKMNNTYARGRGARSRASPTAFEQALDSSCVDVARVPAVHGSQAGEHACSSSTISRYRRWAPRTCYWEPKGAFTGEISVRHAQGCPLRVLHRRPLRASRLLRRNQRGRQSQGPRAASMAGLVCCGMRRRIAVRARRERRRPRVRHAPRCAPRIAGLEPEPRPASAWWHTSPSGLSARAARPRPSRPQDMCAAIRATARRHVRRRDRR